MFSALLYSTVDTRSCVSLSRLSVISQIFLREDGLRTFILDSILRAPGCVLSPRTQLVEHLQDLSKLIRYDQSFRDCHSDRHGSGWTLLQHHFSWNWRHPSRQVTTVFAQDHSCSDSLSLQIHTQSNLVLKLHDHVPLVHRCWSSEKKTFSWVEMLVSKVALLILCAIVFRMSSTPEPARAPTLAPSRISTMAPTMAQAYAAGANGTHVPSMSPTSEEASSNLSGCMMKFT